MSNLSVSDVVTTLVAYTLFYATMFVIGFYLMKKYAKKGPVPPEDDNKLDDAIGLGTQGANA